MNTNKSATTERQAWIALASVPGIGDTTFGRLLNVFGSASSALHEVARLSGPQRDRRLASLLTIRSQTGIVAGVRKAAAEPNRIFERMERLGGWILTPLDEGYPADLLRIDEPPLVIYGLGQQAALTGASRVAMVGTRRPSIVGRDLAHRVATRLAELGVTTISGLALGIDGAAHEATLEADGQTVAVVGSGLDDPGPARHRRLARAIVERGALVSELAPGVRATRGTFPRRNRIISGLASTTIVIEAPARSGALITAGHALEQGRGLLVAPGRPLDPLVAGCLALLRESPARPLVGIDEMVVDLGLTDEPTGANATTGTADPHGASSLSVPERAVAEQLTLGPQSIDHLVTATRLEPGVVAAALTILQLRGWARVHGAVQLPAGPLLRQRRQTTGGFGRSSRGATPAAEADGRPPGQGELTSGAVEPMTGRGRMVP